MSADSPKPLRNDQPDVISFRASPFRVLRTFIPFFMILLFGCAAQLVLRGELSEGMPWVVLGSISLAGLFAVLIPLVNQLHFSPEGIVIREFMFKQRFQWSDIDPTGVTYVQHKVWFVTLFAKVGFRLLPGAASLTTIRQLSAATSGLHMSFINCYAMGNVELVNLIILFRHRFAEKPVSGEGGTQ